MPSDAIEHREDAYAAHREHASKYRKPNENILEINKHERRLYARLQHSREHQEIACIPLEELLDELSLLAATDELALLEATDELSLLEATEELSLLDAIDELSMTGAILTLQALPV